MDLPLLRSTDSDWCGWKHDKFRQYSNYYWEVPDSYLYIQIVVVIYNFLIATQRHVANAITIEESRGSMSVQGSTLVLREGW